MPDQPPSRARHKQGVWGITGLLALWACGGAVALGAGSATELRLVTSRAGARSQPVRLAARGMAPCEAETAPAKTVPNVSAPAANRSASQRGPQDAPITKVSVDIRPTGGELPPNAAAEALTQSRQAPVPADVQRGWGGAACFWQAPAVCHGPLYFEQVNVERYGYSAGLLQPLVSGAHFFSSVVALPYFVGARPPGECIYTLGYYRAGTPTPLRTPRVPLSVRGAVAQGAVVTGAVFAIP